MSLNCINRSTIKSISFQSQALHFSSPMNLFLKLKKNYFFVQITAQAEYFERFPRSLIPVQVTDVFFAIHGIIASLVIAVQCFCYEVWDVDVNNQFYKNFFIFKTFSFEFREAINESRSSQNHFYWYSDFVWFWHSFYLCSTSFNGWISCTSAVISSYPSHWSNTVHK